MGCACVLTHPSLPVRWFPPDSPNADNIILQPTGFGVGRSKSYFKSISLRPGINRKGNEFGQLGGSVIFFHAAKKNDHYTKDDGKTPIIRLKKKRKIFAKAFLMCPMGRMPVGENNVKANRALAANERGPVLLAAAPKIVALFVKVDGEPRPTEILSLDSVDEVRKQYRDMKPHPEWPQRAVPGSFFTYMPSRHQDEYVFIHLPLVAELEDTELETGSYASDLVVTFCGLLLSLSPGAHEISFEVRCYYDHCDFNYLVLDKNYNPMGQWKSKLSNERLVDPHQNPRLLHPISKSVASGSMKLIVPNHVIPLIKGLLERKPPVERYRGTDRDIIKKEAKV
jgi:hypothetical protein